MREKKPLIAVVGALNVDLAGRAGEGFRLRDSIPGRVELSLGGVGRNIAQNLYSFGEDVRFLTVLGDDPLGQMVRSREEGVPLLDALVLPGEATGTYLFINDDKGDLVAAVNDMDLMERFTPELLAEKEEILSQADLLVVEGNLPRETLNWLCGRASCPVAADPVSAVKAKKLFPVLGKLSMIKPNELELEFFTGIRPDTEERALEAARTLAEKGPALVFASLGARGMVYATRDGEAGLVPSLTRHPRSTNGAGDFCMALLCSCLARGCAPREAAWLAMRGVAGKLEDGRVDLKKLGMEGDRR